MRPSTRVRWAEASALTTAGTVAVTILCCLPFATGIVGAGLAAFGARFEPLRPYLTVVSLGSLAYAAYVAYRPSTVMCTDGSCEAPIARRARRMLVWIVAAVVVLFLTASWWASWVIYWTL